VTFWLPTCSSTMAAGGRVQAVTRLLAEGGRCSSCSPTASTHKSAGGGVRSRVADVVGGSCWFALCEENEERPCSRDACSWANAASIGGSPC
jgi:hypothetical protein